MFKKIKFYLIIIIASFSFGAVSTYIYTTGRIEDLETRAVQLATKLADYDQAKQDNEKRLARIEELETKIKLLNSEDRAIGIEIGSRITSLSKGQENIETGLSIHSEGIQGIYNRLSEIIEEGEGSK